MGFRLSKIYTRTGDAGTTGLGDGSRVSKDALRVIAMGDVDETNALIGVMLCETMPESVSALLHGVQNDLFDLGGELSIPGSSFITEVQVDRLETAIDFYNAELAPLKEFILPAGTRAASHAHQVRTVCRRAERQLVALAGQESVGEAPRQYLNRLSDLMFVLARYLNKAAGSTDVLWQKGKHA
jgi:cob(I)alamin adenosyltransferase